MNILIPMAGEGSRFLEKGYVIHKPVLPLTSRFKFQTIPMVVAAVLDLPFDFERDDINLHFIIRDFHVDEGVDQALLKYFPEAQFIVIDALSNGQASTCLVARQFLDNSQPLLITACDNGIDVTREAFEANKVTADALIFTFRNNDAVCEKPEAFGWVQTSDDIVTGVSIKQPISSTPKQDHAIVGTFWFKQGRDFFTFADKMIAENDRINGEFYVDQIFKYLLKAKRIVKVIEVERYLCWGTPEDYENYQATLNYWKNFLDKNDWI
jgi:dTDP-glucose pyrophosphorylase